MDKELLQQIAFDDTKAQKNTGYIHKFRELNNKIIKLSKAAQVDEMRFSTIAILDDQSFWKEIQNTIGTTTFNIIIDQNFGQPDVDPMEDELLEYREESPESLTSTFIFDLDQDMKNIYDLLQDDFKNSIKAYELELKPDNYKEKMNEFYNSFIKKLNSDYLKIKEKMLVDHNIDKIDLKTKRKKRL